MMWIDFNHIPWLREPSGCIDDFRNIGASRLSTSIEKPFPVFVYPCDVGRFRNQNHKILRVCPTCDRGCRAAPISCHLERISGACRINIFKASSNARTAANSRLAKYTNGAIRAGHEAANAIAPLAIMAPNHSADAMTFADIFVADGTVLAPNNRFA